MARRSSVTPSGASKLTFPKTPRHSELTRDTSKGSLNFPEATTTTRENRAATQARHLGAGPSVPAYKTPRPGVFGNLKNIVGGLFRSNKTSEQKLSIHNLKRGLLGVASGLHASVTKPILSTMSKAPVVGSVFKKLDGAIDNTLEKIESYLDEEKLQFEAALYKSRKKRKRERTKAYLSEEPKPKKNLAELEEDVAKAAFAGTSLLKLHATGKISSAQFAELTARSEEAEKAAQGPLQRNSPKFG